MKKNPTLILLLIFVLCITMFMTACGGSSSEEPATDEATEEAAEEATEEVVDEATEEATEEANEDATEDATAPTTLEEYLNENNTEADNIQGSGGSDQVQVSWKDNDLIYSYDFSKLGNYTEEQIKDEAMIAALENTVAEGGPTFGNIAKTLEDATGITGINIVVAYYWEDEVLLSKTFTTADAE